MRLESLLDALRAKDDVIEFAYAELAVTFELGGTNRSGTVQDKVT